MTHVRITIDNHVEFDGSVTEWKRQPPDMFADMIKPTSNPQPHMKAIAIAMADAVMAQRSTTIDVATGVDEWTMKVRYR